MRPDTALTWFALGVLTKRRYDMLLQRFGDLDAALAALDRTLLETMGCKPEMIEQTIERQAAFNATRYAKRMEHADIGLVSIEEDSYPKILREIPDPPVFLGYRGDLSLCMHPCLGIVGTRAMSHYGKRVVEAFVPTCVAHHVVTVSGLALGIDSAVARQTLLAGGKTVAVLGSGLQSIYPLTNTSLAEEIVAGGGLLLSEFPLDIVPTKYTFPSRNRLIAALSRGVLVVEAGEKSGALITADLAIDYGREAFAVPGSVFSEGSTGCHAIITRGEAKLVTSPEEVLREIGVLYGTSTAAPLASHSYISQHPDEDKVLSVLSRSPQSSSEIVETSGLEPGQVSAALTALELAGVAGNTMEGWIRR